MARRNRPRAPAPHEDSGLQPERTALAWGRTMLTLTVVASLFLRWMQLHGWLSAIPLLLCLLVALCIWLTQRRRYQRGAAGIRAERLEAAVPAVLLIGLSVMGMAALAIVAVLSPR